MKDFRKCCPIFQNNDVWNEIINIRDTLSIGIDYANDNSFVLADYCAAFRIFPFAIVDGRWVMGTSLDIFDNKTNIENDKERFAFNKLLNVLNESMRSDDTSNKTTIKDLGNDFINMKSNDLIIEGFIINIDGKEVFSKELSLKLSAPGDDCHVEYRCKFYVE